MRFTLFSTKEPKTPTYITLYFHYRGKRLKYSTGEKVCPEAWDFTSQRAKANGKFPEGVDINITLNDLEKYTVAIYRETTFGQIEPADFAAELDRRMGFAPGPDDRRPKPPALFDFIPAYIEEKKAGLPATWRKIQSVYHHLQQYAQERARNLDYEGIDYAFFADFKAWLFAPPRNHSTNHAAKVVSVLKQFMREAQRRGYHSKTDYQGFTIKKTKTTKVALSFEELEHLYSLDLSGNSRLEKVRDLFLIGAYTGLRFSDFTRIRPEHIEKIDGKLILTITTQKTGETVSIPLFPIPAALLKKYDYHPPQISNQKMNDYLKELGQLAGLTGKMIVSNTAGGKRNEQVLEKWEKLTTHVARRSFATNFYRDTRTPAAVLMKITGHATERQFMQYIAIDGKMNALHFAELRKDASLPKVIKLAQ